MRPYPKKIMCAVDFSDFSESVLAWGATLADRFSAEQVVAHSVIDVARMIAYSDTQLDAESIQQNHTAKARAIFTKMMEGLPQDSRLLIGQGDPAEEIRRLARKENADIVIAATHGESGIRRLLIGSVTEKLLKILDRSLLVLPMGENSARWSMGSGPDLKKILVGIDFSEDSREACQYGLSLARAIDGRIGLAHVAKPPDRNGKTAQWAKEHQQLENRLRSMIPDDQAAQAEVRLQEGEPYKALVACAEKEGWDMIVLGVRGHTLWERLMVGSTTDRVVRSAHCPILAVRGIDSTP